MFSGRSTHRVVFHSVDHRYSHGMQDKATPSSSTGPRLVERALDVLTALAEGPRGLTVVANEVGLSKATVHRILAGLAYRDFVIQSPETGEYMLGAGSLRLGRRITDVNGGLAALVGPALNRLRTETGETIVLHVRLGRRRVCIAEYESQQPLRYTVGIGADAPLHVGGAGKVLIAWMNESELTQILPEDLEALTDFTITSWDVLRAELAEVRDRGWAESHGERMVGAFALSAPVFSRDGEVIAVASVLGPDARLNHARAIELRLALLAATKEASAAMGTGR
jgi:DNA-binding IclR family transcriptional regulator